MDTEKKGKLFRKYPYHIAMLVKAAQKAIKEGRIRIENGKLVANTRKSGDDHLGTK